MKNYFVQLKYDTMKDASCGGVYTVPAPYYEKVLFNVQDVIDRIGCENPQIVKIYLHEPSVDEIDDALQNFKKDGFFTVSHDVIEDITSTGTQQA